MVEGSDNQHANSINCNFKQTKAFHNSPTERQQNDYFMGLHSVLREA